MTYWRVILQENEIYQTTVYAFHHSNVKDFQWSQHKYKIRNELAHESISSPSAKYFVFWLFHFCFSFVVLGVRYNALIPFTTELSLFFLWMSCAFTFNEIYLLQSEKKRSLRSTWWAKDTSIHPPRIQNKKGMFAAGLNSVGTSPLIGHMLQRK